MILDKKTPFSNLFLLLISIIISLLILELFLTKIDYPPTKIITNIVDMNTTSVKEPMHYLSKDRILIYEPKINYKNLEEGIFTNSYGFRDYEFKLEKNKTRIVVLGDSVVLGSEVKDVNKTYPKLLEKKFKDYNKSIEVYNMGVIGYNPIQESRLYEKIGKKFDPDLVIVGYVINNDQTGKYVIENDKLITYYDSFPYIEGVPYNSELSQRVRIVRLLNKITIDLFNIKNIKYTGTDPFSDLKDAITKLKRNSEDKIIFVIFPQLTKKDQHKERDFIKNILDQRDILWIDLHNSYVQNNISSLKCREDDYVHPNKKGYKIAADETFNFLINNSII